MKKIVSIISVIAVLAMGSVSQAATNVTIRPIKAALPTPELTIVVPGVTPVASGTINTTLGLLTQAPASIGATVIADAVKWIIDHGALSTGPGITVKGGYGAMVGQDVTVYQVGIVGTNNFDVTVSHANYFSSTGGDTDEFGIGISKTMKAPKWLSNFVIITTKPSTIKLGVGVYMPTTYLAHAKFRSDVVLFGPRVSWAF